MAKLMRARRKPGRRGPLVRGLFFQGAESGVVHLVDGFAGLDGARAVRTTCGRLFKLSRSLTRPGAGFTSLRPAYRACKACAAVARRTVADYERGLL